VVDISTIYAVLTLKAPGLLHGFLLLVLVYAIPVAYFTSLISILTILTWSSLAKRYPGVNSPGGIGTVIGVVPSIVFLFVGVESGLFLGNIGLIGGLFSVVVFAAFVGLLTVVVRLMSNERMLV
jgi:hypothetical protein